VFLVLFGKIKNFLLLFKIFMGFFVKEIIKDFCQRKRTIAGFLPVGFLGDF
jgi:hypothetical protein